MKLKFCGIRRKEDVCFCNQLLPDYMGMILSPGFRRSVSPTLAAELAAEKRKEIRAVGVFVDAPVEEMVQMAKRIPLDVIQLHGEETAEIIAALREKTGLPVWKAVRMQKLQDIWAARQFGADMLLIEGFTPGQAGGTGQTADWQLLAEAALTESYFLAGGLCPENLRAALTQLHPTGVDLSSGIETDGVKDWEKMREIVKIVRGE